MLLSTNYKIFINSDHTASTPSSWPLEDAALALTPERLRQAYQVFFGDTPPTWPSSQPGGGGSCRTLPSRERPAPRRFAFSRRVRRGRMVRAVRQGG